MNRIFQMENNSMLRFLKFQNVLERIVSSKKFNTIRFSLRLKYSFNLLKNSSTRWI
ncbi:hypothetical protein LEP1GSC188_3673 [Leptospira weilii serovar Topaz str. LT2116]|uniref:Uncharacterized protein n=1 Tax=Leptospira weilii serovar Topaz str. LT2116 TaxID=1088540 RepID=M3GVT5_9LEPT|nr:hypothetical protein LEP1GSC188_3673 [Leptospira weilii serovar Topaz str. LT2116]